MSAGRARGVTKPFDVSVIAHAWRGAQIAHALITYLDDHAQVIGHVGHNGFMDMDKANLHQLLVNLPLAHRRRRAAIQRLRADRRPTCATWQPPRTRRWH
jgi:hypothetical protein